MKARHSLARKFRLAMPATLAAAAFTALPASAANTGTDWLWLSASLSGCTFTITVDWNGYPDAKYVEVFVTDGYTGAPILPTAVRIKNKDNHAVVTMPPMVPSTTQTFYYSWAQLVDTHGNAIPASLDFTGQQGAYCAAP
ncbi:MAG TPA: hypothetical protein VFP44_01550 [Usitatibacter sp.]|nr:hypothetical protein [Usitatibacter sp.]